MIEEFESNVQESASEIDVCSITRLFDSIADCKGRSYCLEECG